MKGKEIFEKVKVGKLYEFSVYMTKNLYFVTGRVTKIEQKHLPLISIDVKEWSNPTYPGENAERIGHPTTIWGNKIHKIKEITEYHD